MSKKIAIMQPTFLPWMGYFAMIDYVDEFVFLDSVQFAKRSWQQRNKIKVGDTDKWISVPVKSKSSFDQNINEVLLSEPEKNCPNILVFRLY